MSIERLRDPTSGSPRLPERSVRPAIFAPVERIALPNVVLRFHWMETLHCSPSCVIEREPVDNDRVGFMRIPSPHPADFVVEQVYP